MNTEHIKQNLSDAGCRDELITEIMTLCERGPRPGSHAENEVRPLPAH